MGNYLFEISVFIGIVVMIVAFSAAMLSDTYAETERYKACLSHQEKSSTDLECRKIILPTHLQK